MSSARTIRFDAIPDVAARASVEASLHARGGSITWNDDAPTRRTYALVESAADTVPAGDTVFSQPIIALAVRPTPPEALSPLAEALCGSGRPAGMASCEQIGDELCIEWDPAKTAPSLIRALLRAEVGRYGGSYTARSLAPLPVAVLAAIAADGLQAPEIAPDRVLDVLVEGLHGTH